MKIQELKLVHNIYFPKIGRCVYCDARNLCGITPWFECKATMSQHYINIKTERKFKLQKLNDTI